MGKHIAGTGILLRTPQGSYVLQQRDARTDRNPEALAPFGGGIEHGETPEECAVRELQEELGITVPESDLRPLGTFESHYRPGTYIQMYVLNNINLASLSLAEGKDIVELSHTAALAHSEVTGFTKLVLRACEPAQDST